MSHFSVDILTPSAVLAKDLPADSLKIPTESGEINVLKDHTHIVSNLSTGILVVTQGSQNQYFCVTSGIVKLLDRKITILARAAERAENVDESRAKKSLELALTKLNSEGALSDEELTKYRRKVSRAQTRIKAYSMI